MLIILRVIIKMKYNWEIIKLHQMCQLCQVSTLYAVYVSMSIVTRNGDYLSLLINRFPSITSEKIIFKDSSFALRCSSCSDIRPLLFTLYTTPLSSLIHTHKLDHHLYADDA